MHQPFNDTLYFLSWPPDKVTAWLEHRPTRVLLWFNLAFSAKKFYFGASQPVGRHIKSLQPWLPELYLLNFLIEMSLIYFRAAASCNVTSDCFKDLEMITRAIVERNECSSTLKRHTLAAVFFKGSINLDLTLMLFNLSSFKRTL